MYAPAGEVQRAQAVPCSAVDVSAAVAQQLRDVGLPAVARNVHGRDAVAVRGIAQRAAAEM